MRQPESPDKIYGDLFELIQTRHIYPDSKTFVDATPKTDVATILDAFARIDGEDTDAVRSFVAAHFSLPADDTPVVTTDKLPPVRERIEVLWDVLSRAADTVEPNSSLIPLPEPYIVPGGRFREVYYWDSYFTMLGLAEAGRFDAIEAMVENFAYLIDEIGFIPNGNRSYFCTRSQPPFFVLMVELLADVRKDDSIRHHYLPQLEKEYDFWMSGSESLSEQGDATRRVVKVGDAYLNRYWDDSDEPRQESYAEDRQHAANANRDVRDYYRNIRAGCESGWDFSSRWLDSSERLESIRATRILPIDLNTLLFCLESCLAGCYRRANRALFKHFQARASQRRHLLRSKFYDARKKFFFDLSIDTLQPTYVESLAAAYPLFLKVASREQAEHVVERIQSRFLASGGWITTLTRSGQQWDRPNGWAPLQWIVYQGFRNYGFEAEAQIGGTRWASDNIDIYNRTGRLLEKYDVERTDELASGGEYDVQDGFGWTNGVLLKLMNQLGL